MYCGPQILRVKLRPGRRGRFPVLLAITGKREPPKKRNTEEAEPQ